MIKTNKKEEKQIEKDIYSLKNLLFIVIIITVIFGAFYFVTTLVVHPDQENNTNNTITEIDSTKITLNNLLNRTESEYYVLATKESNNSQVNYMALKMIETLYRENKIREIVFRNIVNEFSTIMDVSEFSCYSDKCNMKQKGG